MANERLVIEVTAKGARVVQGQIAGIGASAKKASTGVGALKATLATLGVGLALRATVNTLRDFSQEISTVAAVTGATGAQFKALSDRARELGATTRFTASSAAEGLTLLGRAGFSAAEAIDTVDDTLRLAQAGGLGLAEASRITAQAIRGFRLESDQAGRVADVLAKAANSANTDVFQLGEAIKFVAPIAAGTGVSLEETTAAISKLSDAGLQASIAGAGLRRVLGDLEAPNKNQLKVLRQLGVAQEDVKLTSVGLSQALRTLKAAGLDTATSFQLFGDRGAAVAEVLTATIDEVDAMTESLEDAEGTAARVAEIMDDNLNGALFRTKSALEAVILSFGELGATEALKNFFDGLAGALRGMAARVDDVVRVLGVAGLVGAILLAKGAVFGLSAAIVANPIGAVVTLLTAGAAAAIFFADEIKIAGSELISLSDLFTGFARVGKKILDTFVANWKRGWAVMRDNSSTVLDDTEFNFVKFATKITNVLDALVAQFISAGFTISAWAEEIEGSRAFGIFKLTLPGGINIANIKQAFSGEEFDFQNIVDASTEGMDFSGLTDSFILAMGEAAKEARKTALEEFAGDDAAGEVRAVAQGPLATVAQAPTGTGGDAADPFADAIAGLDRQNQLLKLSSNEREVQIQLEEALNQLRKEGIEFLLPADLMALENKIRTNVELENQIEKTTRLQSTIANLESQVGSLDLVFESLVLGAVTEFTDALFAFDGNFFDNLKKGLSDLTAEIAKAIVKMLLLRAISSAFGGTSFGNFLGIGGNAIGGAVRAGEPTIVGERRPELFIPQESGRIVPNVNVQAQAGPTMVAVVKSEQEAEELILSRGGKRAVLQVINENPKAAGGR